MEESNLANACYRYEQRITELERTLRSMWRDMDVARMRGTLPDDLVDGWKVRLSEKGVEVE